MIVEVELEEWESLCKDLCDMALETTEEKDRHVLLRILQLFLYGKEEAT